MTTTPAIPTTFDGVQYRSRLEARWAAFFNKIGWKYTYEPFDGDGYIPDFLIHGAAPLLVEVKPAVTRADFDAVTGKVERGLAGVWQRDVLIVGADPLPDIDPNYNDSDWFRPAGLLGEFCGEGWDFDAGLWFTCDLCLAANVHHPVQSFAGRPCGHYDGDGYLGPVDTAAIRGAWAAATNAVKWVSQ